MASSSTVRTAICSLDALVQRHVQRLFRFFSNKVVAEAADLVQRTFMACVEQRDEFREDAAFRTFLFAIAKRRLYPHFEPNRRYSSPRSWA